MAGNRRLMVGAVLVIVLGSLGVIVVMKMFGPRPAQQPQEFTRVVPIEEIPPHVIVTEQMVREDKVKEAPAGVAEKKTDVVGKITARQLAMGQPIPKDAVAELSNATSAAHFVVPEGKRAVAILIDPETGIGGLITVGDHVDIVVYYRVQDDTMARTIAQDIVVLATEQSVTPTTPVQAGGPEGKEASKAATPSPPAAQKKQVRVILAVSPEEAQQIVAAKDKGNEITPVLRNPQSREIVAQLGEAWEHPRTPHKHLSRSYITATPGGTGPGEPTRATPLPPMATAAVGGGPIAPVGVEVQIIRGTMSETKNVPR